MPPFLHVGHGLFISDSMIVGVHPLAGFDKVLHYKVPEELRATAVVGALVRVPIMSALRLGVVCEIAPPKGFPIDKLKSISQVVYPFPALTEDLLPLASWMANYYAAPMDSIIETMIPAAVRCGAAIKIQKQLSILKELNKQELEKLTKRAPQQAKLYAFLKTQTHPVAKAVVLNRLHMTASSADSLIKAGVIQEEGLRIVRDAYEESWAVGEKVIEIAPTPNLEQQKSIDEIGESVKKKSFSTWLIHGVTGSGKTEVYLKTIEQVLKSGGGVIFLVPEVALTPQTVSRLRSRLEAIAPGHKCVVWHSALSEGERLDGWLALATGEARIVVGARSAVFAPIRDLRLIVVDEEHEPAYKQDETPRYHGRDVAVMRAKLACAVCVLGSATPSLESYLNAVSKRYHLSELKSRVDSRKLPHIHVVDMKIEVARQRGFTTLSRKLVDAMQDRLSAKEQIILFINRRGYSPSVVCTKCGHAEECTHCSITMTYHRSDERIRCHLCGEEKASPVRCPSCGSPEIRSRGMGTQRVEEAVRRVIPRARIARVDTDTMNKKHRLREILSDFRLGKIDVLVGTQMIGKGLDFPNVTLVGLIDADLSMHIPDFRANERTFQLLVQVAGRAGRGAKSGDVFVQTFTPASSAIQFSRHANYNGFADAELTSRKCFGYPPYRHIIHHLFKGPNPEKLAFFTSQWVKQVKEKFGDRIEVKGPTPAPIDKIKDQYRWQVWYFVPNVTPVIAELSTLRAAFQWPGDLTQSLDVDPSNLV